MDELRAFIQLARSKNKSDAEIKKNLLQAGWQEELVNKALGNLSDDLLAPPPPSQLDTTHKRIGNVWDAFEHVLLFTSLYVLATSIGLILQYFVDKWLPGVRVNSYAQSDDWQLTLFRGYLASLIVSLPLFCFFFLRITKRTIANPEIRNLSMRKILTYLTLIGTFIIMLINIVAVVYAFLSGNVSLNFILHLFVTLLVSGIIFAYYIAQVKEDRKSHA